MEHNIFSQIRKETSDFFDLSISPVPGYNFNQYDTVKLCHLYRNSKFESDAKYLGRDKIFFNVVNPACEVATKQLNIDTKNIRLWPTNPKSYFSTYLLEKELKLWLKKAELGKTLNKLAEEAPVYGSVVIEKTKKGAELVDIRRLILDPSVESITDSRFVTTVHYMTPSQLRETGWKDVDVAIERFSSTQASEPFEDKEGDLNQQESTPYIKIYKRYGEVPKGWLDGSRSDEMVKSLFIVAGADYQETSADGQPVGEQGVILFESRWQKEWPFRDFHYTKTKGRWLGIGVIEMLFDVQMRMNELKNQKRVSMELSTIQLYQTKDKQLVRNVLTDLETGDVLYSQNGLERVENEERNLSAFGDEEQSYAQQVERLSFAYEAVRGETPPSSTPLGTTEIVTAQAQSVFGFKRENFALMVREFFNELVMPQLLKDLTAEHIMRFTGSAQELLKIDTAAAEIYANDLIKKSIVKGRMLTMEEIDAAKEQYIGELKKLGTTRFIKIKDALYDDLEFEFDYVVDNENVDPQVLAINLQRVIGDISGNPAILQDPRLKLLYFKFAEKLGVNPAEMELADEQAQDREQEIAQMAQAQPQMKPLAQPVK